MTYDDWYHKCEYCVYFEVDKEHTSFGWCSCDKRKIPASEVFPNGTMPSTGTEHGKNCKEFIKTKERV